MTRVLLSLLYPFAWCMVPDGSHRALPQEETKGARDRSLAIDRVSAARDRSVRIGGSRAFDRTCFAVVIDNNTTKSNVQFRGRVPKGRGGDQRAPRLARRGSL